MNLIDLQKNFINLRLGAFIHFNSATAQFHNNAEIIDWEYDVENGGAARKFPFDEKDWNPDKLDFKRWAKILKSAGCRFVAYTSKHHEGFATWPTKYSEHCVRNATNKTDIVAEYLKAFREEGIIAGLYFSILDVTAGYNRKVLTEEGRANIKGQITELLTNYGEIPFLMVDGWNSPWGGPTYDMLPFEEIDALVKSIQPNCLLLNIGWNKDLSGSDIVFYENGAGQKLDHEFNGPGILCQKLTRTWFWRDDDPITPPASTDWAIDLMNDCFSRNVNFMLNLSPDFHGQIDDNLADALAEFGTKVVLPAPLEEVPEGWMTR